jgi:lipoprotein-releasing system permease protein
VINPLARYFVSSLFHRRTRQGPLLLASVGLFLAAFSLIFLQSTMSGLQNKLMDRSKRVIGHYVLQFDDSAKVDLQQALNFLQDHKINYVLEYEIEALLRFRESIVPVVLHAVEDRVPFFDERLQDLIVPFDLSYKTRVSFGDRVELIFPGLVDSFLEDIPRSSLMTVQELFGTDVPEIDGLHVWCQSNRLFNVLRHKSFNRLRLHQQVSQELQHQLQNLLPAGAKLLSWNDQHPTLVYALKLEAFMMAFLFAIMSLLVALAIVSGLLILWNKLKFDMASFWILGASKDNLATAPKVVVILIAIVPTLFGLGAGFLALHILSRYGGNFMPDVFVDRNIPVVITLRSVLISVLVPMSMAIIFGMAALRSFYKQLHFVDLVRSTGNH